MKSILNVIVGVLAIFAFGFSTGVLVGILKHSIDAIIS